MYQNSLLTNYLEDTSRPQRFRQISVVWKEVGWGSFLEASIVIESVLVFKNQESAGKAFGYCQNSSDILKLALSFRKAKDRQLCSYKPTSCKA